MMNKTKKSILSLTISLVLSLCAGGFVLYIARYEHIRAIERGDYAFFSGWPATVHNTQGDIRRQALCAVIVFLIGYLVLWILDKKTNWFLRGILAFPCGLAVVFTVALILLSVGIPYTFVSLAVGVFVFVALCFLFMEKTRLKINLIKEMSGLLYSLSIMMFVIGLAILVPYKMVSNDSIMYYQLIGEAISAEQALPNVSWMVLSVGPFQPILSTLSSFFGFYQTIGFQKILSLSAALFFGYVTYAFMSDRIKKIWRFALSILVAVVTWTQIPIMTLSFYQMSNVYAMVYMFLALGLIYLMAEKDYSSKDFQIMLALSCIGVGLSRIEGLIFVVLLAVVAIPTKISNKSIAFSILLPSTVCTALYYGYAFLVMKLPSSEYFVSIGRMAVMLIASLVAILFVLFFRDKNILKTKTHLWQISIIGLFAAYAFLSCFDLYRAYSNIYTSVMNLTSPSIWGFCSILVVFFVLILIYRRFKLDILSVFTINYVILQLVLYAFRVVGMRYGYGDSGSRAFMQLVPILSLYIVFEAVKELNNLRKGKVANLLLEKNTTAK